ncbi:hypothetical protein HQ520_04695 [bacterium]|nr:hypothetical protein [bacterium]
METIRITAENREQALREALSRLRLPEEALDLEWGKEEEDLLPGARAHVSLSVCVRPEYVTGIFQDVADVMLDRMGFSHETTIKECHGMWLVQIDCEESEILIGYQGETLDALQHLVARMTDVSGREIPLVMLDVGQYRENRIERLKKVADDLCEAVLENDVEEYFDPMNSVDRKIVHTLLKDKTGIRTFSRGEDEDRKVYIAPE